LSLSKITDICAFFDEALPECHTSQFFYSQRIYVAKMGRELRQAIRN